MTHFNYIVVIIILMLGLWAMIAKKNIIKKLIGMAIFQTGIILFYISMGAKKGSTIPILDHHHLHDPIIAETFGTVAKNAIWTMYDRTISVDRTNPTITGLINCNALTRIHSCIMIRMAKPNKLIHCLES